MKRMIAFCPLLLATVLGYIHIDSQPAWVPFAVVNPSEIQLAQAKSQVTEPQVDWLPDTGAASVHAASLITLKNGEIRAFWFAGSREGAKDVVINSAVFNPAAASWGAATVVMDRVSAEKGLSRYIAKLGNPVPARMSDGRLQLFFVTVSVGGWAGSSISSITSDDEGISWSQPKRLITSPFINLSTLVKSPAIAFSDGRMGLPAYHEWIGRFGELLRIDAEQVIDKRRMSSGRGAIQPVVFVDDAQQASALFRQTRGGSEVKQIPLSQTSNAGQSWQVMPDVAIANPNSAIASLALSNGVRLLVLNNIEAGRYRLVMVMSKGSSDPWRVVQVLENDEASPYEQRQEFSYPYLISADGSDAHLVYTWDRKKIRHRYFSAAWLLQTYSQAQAAEQIDSKEAQ